MFVYCTRLQHAHEIRHQHKIYVLHPIYLYHHHSKLHCMNLSEFWFLDFSSSAVGKYIELTRQALQPIGGMFCCYIVASTVATKT